MVALLCCLFIYFLLVILAEITRFWRDLCMFLPVLQFDLPKLWSLNWVWLLSSPLRSCFFFLMLWVEAARIDRSFLLLLNHRFRYLHVHWASLLFETVGYSLITDECEFDECNFGWSWLNETKNRTMAGLLFLFSSLVYQKKNYFDALAAVCCMQRLTCGIYIYTFIYIYIYLLNLIHRKLTFHRHWTGQTEWKILGFAIWLSCFCNAIPINQSISQSISQSVS